jgi:histidine decarboxylase
LLFLQGVRLAQKFEALVLADQRFEIPAQRHLGMVVFRLRGENHLTERLLKRLNARGNLHCVPAALKGRYVIRFTVTSQRTTGDDITRDWAEIRAVAAEILGDQKQPVATARARVPLAGVRGYSTLTGLSHGRGNTVALFCMGLMSQKKGTTMKNGGFWDVTPCGSCKNQRFGGTRNR